jgi:hypothetical protein
MIGLPYLKIKPYNDKLRMEKFYYLIAELNVGVKNKLKFCES